MLATGGWWGQFWADFIADGIVAVIFGVILAGILRRGEEARETQRELTRALELLRQELSFNRDQAELAGKQLGQGHLLFPLFDAGTGDVLLNNP